jgi:hypothetical protein
MMPPCGSHPNAGCTLPNAGASCFDARVIRPPFAIALLLALACSSDPPRTSCQGTPEPCSSLREKACRAQDGCHWEPQAHCDGIRLYTCGIFASEEHCKTVSECTWVRPDGGPPFCYGLDTIYPKCDQATPATGPLTAEICTVFGGTCKFTPAGCSGEVPRCEDLDGVAACQAVDGCEWK